MRRGQTQGWRQGGSEDGNREAGGEVHALAVTASPVVSALPERARGNGAHR